MAKPPERGAGKSDLKNRNTKRKARIPFSLAATGNGRNLMQNFPTNHDGAQPLAPSSDNSNPTLTAAIQAAELGFSIVSVSPSTKRPTVKWEAAQTRAKTPEEVAKLKTLKAFAIVGGAVSGGFSPEGEQLYLTSIDFDVHGFFERYKTDLGDLLDGVSVQKTGGGCYQVIFRSAVEIRNTQLAFAPNDAEETGREIAIETRGEGGYFVAPPSLHPTGNIYQWIEGDLGSVPTISAARAQALLDAARRMNAAPYTRQQLEAHRKREQSATPRQLPNTPNASVIGAFNAAHSVEEMLEQHGYKLRGDRYARPGGSSPSVTILDGGSFHHSSNDPLRCDEHTQDAFSIFAYYEHGDDYKSAVKSAAAELAMSYGNSDNSPSNAGAQRDDRRAVAPDGQPQKPRLIPIGELRKRPAPKWLIQRFLVQRATSLFTADSGSYKSFVALHIAYCVAHAMDFFGRGVRSGAVVYVAGEGGDGIRARSMAWDAHHKRDAPANLFVWENAVQVARGGDVTDFLDELEAAGVQPALIIFDTLNRCAEGLEENSAKDMGLFCAGLERVKRATGAHVCVVHHNNAGGKSRGSTALPGAFETRFSAERDGSIVTMRCQKQKDGAPEFEPFALEAISVEIGETDEYGDPITSLVLKKSDVIPKSEKSENGHSTAKERTCAAILEKLKELRDKANGGEVTKLEWMEATTKAGICNRSTFYQRVKEMEADSRWHWCYGDCQIYGSAPDEAQSDESEKSEIGLDGQAETAQSEKSEKSESYVVTRTNRTDRTNPADSEPYKAQAPSSKPNGEMGVDEF